MTTPEQISKVELTCPPDNALRELSIGAFAMFIEGSQVYQLDRSDLTDLYKSILDSEEHFVESEAFIAVHGINANLLSHSVSRVNEKLLPHTLYSPFEVVRESDTSMKVVGVKLNTKGSKVEYFPESADLSRLTEIEQTIRGYLVGRPNTGFSVDDLVQVVAYAHPRLDIDKQHVISSIQHMVQLHTVRYKALSDLRFKTVVKEGSDVKIPMLFWVE